MIFDSLTFAVFLPITFLVYWAVSHKYRWIFLLAANYWFYMSGSARYGLLLTVTMAVTYVCALQIERRPAGKGRKFFLWLGAGFPLAALLYFKYASFLWKTVLYLAKALSAPAKELVGYDLLLQVIIPLGISFYTFKAVSYVVDVYRGRQRAERHFGYYACFLSYFPDVISGPIDRAEILLPQLKKDKRFCYEDGVYALRMMLLGYAKKLLLADVLTGYTDMIFNNVTHYSGFTLLFASFLFTLQIYCDFSGYSDIAMGVSKLFGIDLMRNFSTPYFARSIREFWKRWHISLSTWFRDYVYIPLGGNRVSKPRKAWNLMATFLVSGLWHGADYTYILWGGIHGLYQVAENCLQDLAACVRRKRMPSVRAVTGRTENGREDFGKRACIRGMVVGSMQTVVTFLLVNFAWIFFRSDKLQDALYFVTHMFSDFSFGKALSDMKMSAADLFMICVFLLFLTVYDAVGRKKDLLREMDRLPMWCRWCLYLGVALVIAAIRIHNGTSQQFIYFRF